MRISYYFIRLFFIGVFYGHSTAIAAVWTIDPGLEIKGIYTDNVFLSAPGSEESESITSVAPILDVRGQGKRSERCVQCPDRCATRRFSSGRTDGLTDQTYFPELSHCGVLFHVGFRMGVSAA